MIIHRFRERVTSSDPSDIEHLLSLGYETIIIVPNWRPWGIKNGTVQNAGGTKVNMKDWLENYIDGKHYKEIKRLLGLNLPINYNEEA